MMTVSKLEIRKKQKEARAKAKQDAAEALVDLSQNVTKIDVEFSSSEFSSFDLSSHLDQLSVQSILLGIKHKLKVEKKILLAAAWSRTDERRLFELFPEVLVVDVTYGTNDEARPQWGFLLLLTGT
jgi:hypothetical protein